MLFGPLVLKIRTKHFERESFSHIFIFKRKLTRDSENKTCANNAEKKKKKKTPSGKFTT